MIILLVGLPGSGKTELAKSLKERLGNVSRSVRIIDDPDENTDLSLIKDSEIAIISDVNLCDSSIYKQAIDRLAREFDKHLHEVQALFFENDEEQCKKNILYRQSKGDRRNVSATLKRFSKIYVPPKIHYKVYR